MCNLSNDNYSVVCCECGDSKVTIKGSNFCYVRGREVTVDGCNFRLLRGGIVTVSRNLGKMVFQYCATIDSYNEGELIGRGDVIVYGTNMGKVDCGGKATIGESNRGVITARQIDVGYSVLLTPKSLFDMTIGRTFKFGSMRLTRESDGCWRVTIGVDVNRVTILPDGRIQMQYDGGLANGTGPSAGGYFLFTGGYFPSAGGYSPITGDSSAGGYFLLS